MDKNARELIKELTASGMTQTDIANEIGVTQGAVSQVVNDSRRRGFRFDVGYRLLQLHASRVGARATNQKARRMKEGVA